MKTILICAALALATTGASALTCFSKGESSSGLTKICYYDCAGSGAAITIRSHELCPLTIERDIHSPIDAALRDLVATRPAGAERR